MRILQLRFQNLNSLVGEWEIDLQDPAFSSDGIFAITGPTGAGKSTILDALCLALYGRTPRLNKLTKSANEIMSRHTGECFAEVLFETQSGRFRCHWSQHRSRKKPDGELQAPKHEISHAESGAVLESKLKGVADQIEAVTGMDFERFTRSMLLAQGGFAVFLQAAPDQRAPILEQITGTDIYSKISVRVHERRREEQEALKLLQAETAGMRVLDAEQEQELEATLAAREAEEQKLALKASETAAAVAWLRRIAELQREITGLAEQEKQLQIDIDAFGPEHARLERAERAAALDGVYASLSAARRSQADDTAALKDEEAALPRLAADAAAQAVALKEAEAQTAQAKEQLATAAPRLRALRALDQKLESQRTTIAELEASCAQDTAKRDEAAQAKEAQQSARAAAEAELEELRRYLREHAADEQLSASLTGIEEQLRGLTAAQEAIVQREGAEQAAAAQLEQASGALEERQQQSERIGQELEASAVQLQQEHTALANLLGDKLLREYRTEKEKLLREQALLARIAQLEDFRHLLEDGKPCPLCGATEHPAAHNSQPAPDELEQAIEQLSALITQAEEQEAAIKKAEEAERSAQAQLSEAEKAQTAATHEVKLTEHRLGELRENLGQLRAELGTREESALAKLAPLGIAAVPQDGGGALLESLRTRLEAWQSHVSRSAEIEKRVAQIDFDILRLDTVIASHSETLAEHSRKLEAAQAERAAGTQERQASYGDIAPDAEEERLNRTVNSAEGAERQARELHHERQQTLKAAQTRIESLTQRIHTRTAELTTLEAEFTTALAEACFANEAAFAAAALPTEQRNALKARARELDERRAELSTRRNDRETRLAAEQAAQLTTEQLSELEPRQAEYEAELTALREAVAGLKHSLRENADAKTRIQEKQQQIESQQKECLRWDTLHELIGSADGKKYRNFAQGLTFEMMIAQANRQLQKLSDRYLLIRDDTEALELNVVDNYQAGEVRSTKNLSGGESFIVSLALALGLSQMAGTKVRVDSLFLDEGFGTLDEEALDTALETLAGLQQDGKMIGIISHVAALKERISTQIQVTPHSGGRSRLSGPGCKRVASS